MLVVGWRLHAQVDSDTLDSRQPSSTSIAVLNVQLPDHIQIPDLAVFQLHSKYRLGWPSCWLAETTALGVCFVLFVEISVPMLQMSNKVPFLFLHCTISHLWKGMAWLFIHSTMQLSWHKADPRVHVYSRSLLHDFPIFDSSQLLYWICFDGPLCQALVEARKLIRGCRFYYTDTPFCWSDTPFRSIWNTHKKTSHWPRDFRGRPPFYIKKGAIISGFSEASNRKGPCSMQYRKISFEIRYETCRFSCEASKVLIYCTLRKVLANVCSSIELWPLERRSYMIWYGINSTPLLSPRPPLFPSSRPRCLFGWIWIWSDDWLSGRTFALI